MTMLDDLTPKEFLAMNRIDEATWEKANIDWSTLRLIASDHKAESANLENSAELIAKVIQKFNGVHSVRWRVKSPEHLVEKIIRKRSEGNPKYNEISQDNYFECVTDLVGVRALHLFKENCFEIDSALKSKWNPIEKTLAYIREGDSEDLRKRFESEGFEVKNHPAGYRSVHYIIESIPLKRRIIAEIQVRTIFEEGWSEIDHKIRYPNFSDNQLVGYFLEIFNRMAGSADDMGGFVLGLVATINHLEEEVNNAEKEKADIFQDMERALSQLESVKERDKESKGSIAKLKMEIAKLKEENQTSRPTGLLGRSIADQAKQGLWGPSLSDVMKLGGLEQVKRAGLWDSFDHINANSLEEAKRGLLGFGSDLEKAKRGLLGSGSGLSGLTKKKPPTSQ